MWWEVSYSLLLSELGPVLLRHWAGRGGVFYWAGRDVRNLEGLFVASSGKMSWRRDDGGAEFGAWATSSSTPRLVGRGG